MRRELKVNFCRDRFDAPLVVIEEGLSPGLELNPHQLRLLAARLLALAVESQSMPDGVRNVSKVVSF